MCFNLMKSGQMSLQTQVANLMTRTEKVQKVWVGWFGPHWYRCHRCHHCHHCHSSSSLPSSYLISHLSQSKRPAWIWKCALDQRLDIHNHHCLAPSPDDDDDYDDDNDYDDDDDTMMKMISTSRIISTNSDHSSAA